MIKMNRVAMITGAAKNTGLAIARRFAREGYDVVITSRSLTEAQTAAAAINADYPAVRVLPVEMNPQYVESIRAAFAQVKKEFDRLDAFVSNAAHLGVGFSVFNSTPEDWDAVMNVNARGSFFGCQEAIKLMRDGGAICMISSVHAKACMPERVLYTASKGAICSMTHALAVEVGHLGIRVNCIIAGAIHTERWDGQSDEVTEARRSKYPAGRESMGDEIASGVYYLCSDEAKTVTGSELTIDSGILSCVLPYQKGWWKK